MGPADPNVPATYKTKKKDLFLAKDLVETGIFFHSALAPGLRISSRTIELDKPARTQGTRRSKAHIELDFPMLVSYDGRTNDRQRASGWRGPFYRETAKLPAHPDGTYTPSAIHP